MTRHWYASVATLALAVITVLLVPLAAAAAPSVSEFPVCTNGFTQVSPAVSGARVVWVDYRSGGLYGDYPDAEIYARTIGGTEALVADTPNTYQVDVSGTYAVWFSGLSGSPTGADIYGIDLTGGAAFPMSTATGDQYAVAISGNHVVWEDDRNGPSVNEDIYGCTLPGVANFPVCDLAKQQRNPDVDGDLVVWEDYRNGNWDIYGRRLSGGADFPICTSAGIQSFPAVSGDIVVWQDYVGGAAGEDIQGYDLSTSTAFPVCTLAGSQAAPEISGSVVVWADMRNAAGSLNSDIYGYDLASKTEFPICTNTGIQTVPDISGSTVVWTDRRNGNDDVYGATLSGVTPAGAPTSTSTYPFAATAGSGWRNSDQTVAISATGGTPPLTINYSLDGGATWQTVPGATANVKVGTEGSHQFQYFASCAGAAEARHDAGYVNIDKTKPVTTAYAARVKKGGTVKLGFKVADASPGCGQARATLRIYHGKKLKKTLRPPMCATNVKKTFSWRATLPVGRYTLKVYATDAAGNAQSKVGSATLTIK